MNSFVEYEKLGLVIVRYWIPLIISRLASIAKAGIWLVARMLNFAFSNNYQETLR